MNKKTVKDIDLKGKRVLMRVDFNVPMADGKVTDDKRIKAALPTIKYVLEQGASLLLMSHLGRPKGGSDPEFSLKAAAEVLAGHLGQPGQDGSGLRRPGSGKDGESPQARRSADAGKYPLPPRRRKE